MALHGLDPMVLPTTALRRLSPRKQPLALGVDVREKDGALLLTLLHGRGLPKELARYALRFLYVQRVDMSEVSVRAASSNRGDFPLSELLSPRDDTWWISTFKEQFEHEWVELATSADGLPRRVAGIKMRIPPLPYGPLSARNFDVCCAGVDGKLHYGTLGGDTRPAELQDSCPAAASTRDRPCPRFSMAAPRQHPAASSARAVLYAPRPYHHQRLRPPSSRMRPREHAVPPPKRRFFFYSFSSSAAPRVQRGPSSGGALGFWPAAIFASSAVRLNRRRSAAHGVTARAARDAPPRRALFGGAEGRGRAVPRRHRR